MSLYSASVAESGQVGSPAHCMFRFPGVMCVWPSTACGRSTKRRVINSILCLHQPEFRLDAAICTCAHGRTRLWLMRVCATGCGFACLCERGHSVNRVLAVLCRLSKRAWHGNNESCQPCNKRHVRATASVTTLRDADGYCRICRGRDLRIPFEFISTGKIVCGKGVVYVDLFRVIEKGNV